MSAPISGNTFASNPTPGMVNPYTISGMQQQSGSDRLLLICITMRNTVTISGITFGGVAMSLIHQTNRGGLQQRMSMFSLANAPIGSGNNIVITFSGFQFNPISIHARAYTNSSGTGALIRNGATATPNTKTITTTQADSSICMTSCSINAFNGVNGQQIPQGTNRSFVQHNTYKQVATGAFSGNTAFTNGQAINCRSVVTNGSVSLDAVEILGTASSGSTRRIFNVT